MAPCSICSRSMCGDVDNSQCGVFANVTMQHNLLFVALCISHHALCYVRCVLFLLYLLWSLHWSRIYALQDSMMQCMMSNCMMSATIHYAMHPMVAYHNKQCCVAYHNAECNVSQSTMQCNHHKSQCNEPQLTMKWITAPDEM